MFTKKIASVQEEKKNYCVTTNTMPLDEITGKSDASSPKTYLYERSVSRLQETSKIQGNKQNM